MKRERIESRRSAELDGTLVEKLVNDLEKGLVIDKNALDEAIEQQPDLYYRVSKELALLISRRDYAKQELEETEASVKNDIRESAALDKAKVSVAEVDAMCVLDREVKKAARELLKLNRDVGLLTALKDAFNQRSYALKDLAALHIANYYSDISGRTDRHQENRERMARERRQRG